MPTITNVEPILLTAPYADENHAEVKHYIGTPHRTCGFVEVTLSDGSVGYGEGYLAVYAPRVFESLVDRIETVLIGKDGFDVRGRYDDLLRLTKYWGRRGPARHSIAAIEMALLDAKGKAFDVPVYQLLGGKRVDSIPLYGSGAGAYPDPEILASEFDSLDGMDIDTVKVGTHAESTDRAERALEYGAERDMDVAFAMSQNWAHPPQNIKDVLGFLRTVQDATGEEIYFLEEALDPLDDDYPLLRSRLDVPIADGETFTTASDLLTQVDRGMYDIVQPDATVIGGIQQLLEVFDACRTTGTEVVVHCWGGAGCLMANYHASFAGGGQLAEWPIPDFALREDLLVEPIAIENGEITPPTAPGLGIEITPEIRERYPFQAGAYVSPAAFSGQGSVGED